MAGQGAIGGGGNWLRGAMSTVLAQLGQQGTGPGQSEVNQFGIPGGYAALQGVGAMSPYTQNYATGQGNAIQNYQQSIPGMMNGSAGAAQSQLNNQVGGLLSPELQSSSNAVGGMQGLAAMMPTAIQNFQSGGYTPQYNSEYNDLSSLLSPNGTANTLINGMGQTDFNVNAQAMANNMLGQGGWTPQLSMALNPVQGILGSQGNTGQSNALFGGGAGLVGSQGQTALTNNMAQTGENLYSGQALMSPAQAAGLARNQAATNYADTEQQAEQQALNRGGGAGATVANGLQNQGMADFFNQESQGTSSAVTNALQNQQQLNLTQQGQGINLAQGGGQLQNALLGTGGGLVGSSGNLANSLFSGGLGDVSSLTNAAANNMSPYVSYGSSGMGNQVSMLGAGSNLELGGLGTQNNTMANQNQYQLGMGNLQNTMTQGAGSLFNSLMGTGGNLSNMLGQLGLGQFSATTGAENAGLNTGVSQGNLLSSILSNYFNPLTSISGQGTSTLNTGLGGMAQLFGGGASTAGGQNPLASSELGAAGALLGMIPTS